MGQHHSIYNLDRDAGYSPRSLGSHFKLMEQGGTTTTCAALLAMVAGPWRGERVAIVGDYAEDSDLTTAPHPASEIWALIENAGGIKNVGWQARKILTDLGLFAFAREDAPGGFHRYDFRAAEPTVDNGAYDKPDAVVLNLDKRQCLTPKDLGDPDTIRGAMLDGYTGGTGTALTALLAVANKGGARGGGDLYSDDPLVGSWGGDRIVFTTIDTDEAAGDWSWEDITVQVRRVLTEAREATFRVDDAGAVTRTW